MRIIGIDPGIARTGWGIVDKEKNIIKAVAYGCFETSQKDSLEERLLALYEGMLSLMDKFSPEVVSVEELFFNTNAKTALIVGHARGVIMLAAAKKKLPIAVYTPLQVKIAVTGYGRAEKKQVGQMIKTLLKLSEVPKLDDTSDALAIGLTHAFTMKM